MYHGRVQQGLTMKEVFKGAQVEWDQETIRRAMRDLQKLLHPAP